MIQKLIDRLLKKRHFWRNVGFNELSELYASEFLRSLAMSVVGIFVPIYLYSLGYPLASIFLMQIIFTVFRPLFSFFAAKSIARIGPKHTMAIGTFAQIVYLLILVSIEQTNVSILLLGAVSSFAYAMYGLALEVDFSKVKHTEHGGKELSFITICERIGSSLGPLVGGLVASFINPKATIIIALLIMAGSLIPIFMSAEPIKARQHITLKGFPWRRHKRDYLSGFFFGVENVVSVMVWPLFVALAVFSTNTYASVGLLVSLSTASALMAFYLIGKLIDDKKGGLLLKFGAISNAVVHCIRPFVTVPLQALTIGVINEPMTASYRMPYIKGYYDASDSVPGYRIVYIVIFDIVRMIGLFVFWTIAYILAKLITDDILVLQILFIFGAIASLGVLFQRFPALRH